MEILIMFLMLVVLILGIVIAILLKRFSYYKMALGNMSAMLIMQRMFELMASPIPAKNKIDDLNKIIIDVFETKYSSIVTYDGIEYNIKASNVEEPLRERLVSIPSDESFKHNIDKNISKYMITMGNKFLGYKSAIERKIKSAMFSPIYYNSRYMGFWILEDVLDSAYDHISKEELAKLKDNIGVFIESIHSQEAIENAHNTDKHTGFYNNIYLYSTVRQKTAMIEASAIILMQFVNLADINDKYGREIGDKLLLKTAKAFTDMLNKEDIPVRYSGSKFCIVCPGTTAETIHSQVEKYLNNIRQIEEVASGKIIKLDTSMVIHTIRKENNLDKQIAKMSNFLDKMQETNTIKII